MTTPGQTAAGTGGPTIFISHRHKDALVVNDLVTVLEKAFYVDTNDIRCTSCRGYALRYGDRLSDALRADVKNSKVVVGVIGPETAESRYVLFELGASWVLGKPTLPVLIGEADSRDVPGPLGDQISKSLNDEANCYELIEDIYRYTQLRRREAAGIVAHAIKVLAERSRTGGNSERWIGLSGKSESGQEFEASWFNLLSCKDFEVGDRIRLRLGESIGRHPARKILIRFLRYKEDADAPVGILNVEEFVVPRNGILELRVPKTLLDVRSISVHGGPNPWGLLRIPEPNGTPSLLGVEVLEPNPKT